MFSRYRSDNGHLIIEWGRLQYLVTSVSRPEIRHLVDLEKCDEFTTACSCEAYEFGMHPCRHILACIEAFCCELGIPEEHTEEFVDRMVFLTHMGHSILEAFQTDSIAVLRTAKFSNPIVAQAVKHITKTEEPKKRQYQLKKGRTYAKSAR